MNTRLMRAGRGPARYLLLPMLLLVAATLYGQSGGTKARPTVVITPLLAPSDDPVALQLAHTITASLSLDMRLSRSVSLTEADFLVPTFSLQASVNYYRQVGAKGAIFGRVAPASSGGYRVEVDIWSADQPHAPVQRFRGTITDVLTTFGYADALALKVASSIVGRPLHDGTLVIENSSGLAKFGVYADGQLLGRNRTTFRVLTGKHQIIIAKPGLLGDVPVKVVDVTITAKGRAVVKLTSRTAGRSGSPEKAAPVSRPRVPAAATTTGASPGSHPAPGAGGAAGGQGSTVIRISPPKARPPGAVRVSTLAAGTFTVDGGHPVALAADGMTTVRSLSPGVHRFVMRYTDGSIEVRKVSVRSGRTVGLGFALDLAVK